MRSYDSVFVPGLPDGAAKLQTSADGVLSPGLALGDLQDLFDHALGHRHQAIEVADDIVAGLESALAWLIDPHIFSVFLRASIWNRILAGFISLPQAVIFNL